MKIFITGGTGYIGRNLLIKLLELGYSVTVYVRKTSDLSVINSKKCRIYYETEVNNLIEHFLEEKYDGVIHLAALYVNSHKPDDINSLINSNILFGTNVLEAASKTDVKWFLNTGTLFQHFNNKQYSPVNLYSATKQAFEDIAKFYTETSAICFKTLKLNDTFGPNDPRSKIFNLLNKISKTGETLEMSAGEQIMDSLYIDDVIRAYLILIDMMMRSKNTLTEDCYAAYSNDKCTLKELVNIFEKVTGSSLKIKWGSRPYKKNEVMIPCNNIQTVPGWAPYVSIEKGIKYLHEYK